MDQEEFGLRYVDRPSAQQLAIELVSAGWVVYVLPSGIDGKCAFFSALRAMLPLDPPVVGDESWDALSDSLWSGLDQLEGREIAIIWLDAAVMADKAPDDFSIALAVLSDVARSLEDVENTLDHSKSVVVAVCC